MIKFYTKEEIDKYGFVILAIRKKFKFKSKRKIKGLS